ncbi:MAG: hypothetical protein SFZ24_12595 [Planctomycetota bacterium]|nr:hypothetical protein [Planctomycetota bacterium]
MKRMLAVCSVIAMSASAALAQNALDGGQRQGPTRAPGAPPRPGQATNLPGRALDANTRVGGGGMNTNRANFYQELAFRNAVVTGNVGGGKAFRGDIGYTAAEDFRGRTGTDDLFRFQRDSAYSGLATQDLRGLSSLQLQFSETTGGQTQGFLGNVIVRRESAGVTSREATGGPAPVSVDPYGTLRGVLRSTSDMLVRNARFPRILGTVDQTSGEPGYLTASSLQGVKKLGIDNSAFTMVERPDLLQQARGAGGPVNPLSGPGADGSGGGAAPGEREGGLESRPGVADPVGQPIEASTPFESLREDLKLRAEKFLSKPYGAPGADAGDGADSGAEVPASRLGGIPETADEQRETTAERFDRMIEEMRRSFREKYVPPANTGETPGGVEGLGMPGQREEDEEGVDGEPRSPLDEPPPTPDEIVQRAAELLDNGELKLESFLRQQGAKDLYSWHMENGDRLLREDRWFDSEERFTAALRVKPGDPMAATGRIHAQIGAGMFRSAAMNLRNLFAAYPEMISARFAEGVFVRGERLKGVRSRLLQRLPRDTDFTPDAALVLAYVGWQTGNADDVRQAFAALDRAHERAGSEPEPLERVLRRVWMD